MRIVLASHSFSPNVGGIETASLSLASEFVRLGHEVRVVTATLEATDDHQLPFRVIRGPSVTQLLATTRWADVMIQNNISLRTVWPALLLRRPLLISVATWVRRPDGLRSRVDRVKLLVLRRARVIAVSQAIADDLPVGATIVNNSYRDDLFRSLPEVQRDRDFVFVGRLVSDKGVDLLIEAFRRLGTNLSLTLTIIGDGDERRRLEKLAGAHGVADRVQFVGVLRGEELVKEINRHHTIVVPSRWREPFGIVALEGIACGCAAVVSDQGGLGEAIGGVGLSFPNGDVDALARALEQMLDPDTRSAFLVNAQGHLTAHRPATEAKRFLSIAETAVARRSDGAS